MKRRREEENEDNSSNSAHHTADHNDFTEDDDDIVYDELEKEEPNKKKRRIIENGTASSSNALLENDNTTNCETHLGTVENYFCITCAKFICAQCVKEIQHFGHKAFLFDENFVTQHYDDLSIKHKELTGNIGSQYFNFTLSIEAALLQLSKVHYSVIKKITSQYDEVLGVIQEKKQKLLHYCEKVYHRKVQNLRHHYIQLRHNFEQMKRISSLDKEKTLGGDSTHSDAENGLPPTLETKVFAAGRNSHHQLAIFQDFENRTTFSHIPVLDKMQIVNISISEKFALALSATGCLYSWGSNKSGQLGIGNYVKYSFSVEKVKNLQGMKIVQICTGKSHSVILLDSGDVYCWGDNSEGQCGFSDEVNRSLPEKVPLTEKVLQIQTGYLHTMALTESRKVLSWGRNETGQLGIGTIGGTSSSPQYVLDLENVAMIYACNGDSSSFALTTSGKVFAFGLNNGGQLGLGHKNNQSRPEEVQHLATKGVIQLGACVNVGFALTNDGTLYGWGSHDGPLGTQGTEYLIPTILPHAPPKIAQIMTNSENILVVDHQQKAFVFGTNGYGELSCGSLEPVRTPLELDQFHNKKVHKYALTGDCLFVILDCKGWPPHLLHKNQQNQKFTDLQLLFQ